MNLLAISGSLRADSIHSALLRAAVRLAPPGMSATVFNGLGNLPLFNPDLQTCPPSVVVDFHSRVAAADAILIASPEYAHGVTGAIKNGLDWLVSFEPFAGKLVAVVNASPRAHHADESLREILKTMAAELVESASITIPLVGANLDEDGMVSTREVADRIAASLDALNNAASAR